jgi:hypothetical protein
LRSGPPGDRRGTRSRDRLQLLDLPEVLAAARIRKLDGAETGNYLDEM